MKGVLLLILLQVLVSGGRVFAQSVPPLLQPLTWEQACLQAARENKLVLVEVATSGVRAVQGVQKNRNLVNWLLRSSVPIRIDMDGVQGKEFESRLLLHAYPAYAYFMPYGDLVGIVSFDEVTERPERLREVLQEAQQLAQIKKSNSRVVEFRSMTFDQVLSVAQKEGKPIFVEFYSPLLRESLLMEKNVFTLDKVADFYNSHFVNVRVDVQSVDKEWKQWQKGNVPAFLYLSNGGKRLFYEEGFCDADRLLTLGAQVLKKAEGLRFESLSSTDARRLAQETGRLVFTNIYTNSSNYRVFLRKIFADPEVADLFDRHFVCIEQEGERAMMLFSDAMGRELHRVMDIADVSMLLSEAQRVLAGAGLTAMKRRYGVGERSGSFMEEYMAMLLRGGCREELSEVAMEYFNGLSPDCLKEARYWEMFNGYVLVATPKYFDYVLIHRDELFGLYGEKVVGGKLTALWMAGAERFIKDGVFDKVGFKAYAKLLKKERVEGWKQITRQFRMNAAEVVGDWKTFIVLAEEKWNEEQISDAELYRWGVMILERCTDENVRYKTAYWLSEKAVQLDRREQLTGRVRMDSYKGFFEKLVNDLLKE